MNATRLDEICERKNALVAECAIQRATLATAWEGIERPLISARTTARKTVATLRSPYVMAGVGLLALQLPKSKLLRIPILVWKGVRLVRRAHSFLR